MLMTAIRPNMKASFSPLISSGGFRSFRVLGDKYTPLCLRAGSRVLPQSVRTVYWQYQETARARLLEHPGLRSRVGWRGMLP